MDNQTTQWKPKHAIPMDILDEIAARFIINMPQSEKLDMIRVFFQIELGHWFYQDQYVNNEETPGKYVSCKIRDFAAHILNRVGYLKPYLSKIDELYDSWIAYKRSVPTCGALILNRDLTKVLLVQCYVSKNSWGFPKGKVNQFEPNKECAVREVLEETGFNISNHMDPDVYLDRFINDQNVSLFVIPGIPDETKFEPRTKFEIADIKWFTISELPYLKDDQTKVRPSNLKVNSFYMVSHFILGLKRWIKDYKAGKIRFNVSKSSSKIDSVNQWVQSLPNTPNENLSFFSPISSDARSTKSKEKTPKLSKTNQERTPKSSKVLNTSNLSLNNERLSKDLKNLLDIKGSPKKENELSIKSWNNFQFNKKEILNELTSVPGWI